LNITETITLTATVLPENAANKSVTWSSSNNDVATVSNGVVTAVALGSATITVITVDGAKTATCAVTVAPVAVTGVTLNHTAATLSLLDELTLVPTVLPANATNPSVTWASSNNAVATVSNGVVTPVAHGSATITVTTTDGNKTAACAVTVNLLGQVSFKTSTIWTIPAAHGLPKQEWSDVVMASGAKKNGFNGDIADCRQNPGYGDLFSWEAVNTYKDQLCPAPWRVPSMQDFIDLDKLMGGTGEYRPDLTFVNDKYLALWGGAFGGNCGSVGALGGQGSWAHYWSATEFSAPNARHLYFDTSGVIYPQLWFNKNYGLTLRCVRN